ncbi:hypothetical protein Vadar_029600 [Vaccinium darrowii]|uniref:Uncharacterized protein n=1 Tax=Vaccinium darrowii TaxID=229202 RepID=A0ACB7XUC6_9ERIC|nr:hypothetical protein Vadar_029600 [Vaccinium darrowii]
MKTPALAIVQPNHPWFSIFADFEYPAQKDSVLVVLTKEDYDDCNTVNPVTKSADGHTVFKFVQSGPFYFISGVKGNCVKNEKLVVVVMADRGGASSIAVSILASIAVFLGQSLLFAF